MSVILPCSLLGIQVPGVVWRTGARTLTTGGDYAVLGNGNLLISEASLADNGVYTCNIPGGLSLTRNLTVTG